MNGMRLLRVACALACLGAWCGGAVASTLGYMRHLGPLELVELVIRLMLWLWPITLALFMANVVLGMFIIRWTNQSLDRRKPAPAMPLTAMVEAGFFLSFLSFTLGPLAALPGLVCAHLARTDRGTPGRSLIVAALAIDYAVLMSVAASLLVASLGSGQEDLSRGGAPAPGVAFVPSVSVPCAGPAAHRMMGA